MHFSRFPSRGQAGLEYMGMAVLITLGLILIGPYVIRSVNAPYKAMEEGALDSQRENIRQAPVQGVTLPTCDCTDLIRQGCGDGTTCSILQAVWARSCGPVGCEADMMSRGIFSSMSECRNEAYPSPCCTAWAPTGNCGVLAVNAPGGRCNDGEMEMRRTCGSPTAVAEYSCQADAACVFGCTGGQSVNSTACANTTIDLIGNQAWSYTPTGVCNGATKCQAWCNPGYAPVNGSCIHHCPNGICEDGRGGRMNLGENQITCAADCSCPDGTHCQGLPASWGFNCASGFYAASYSWNFCVGCDLASGNRVAVYAQPNGSNIIESGLGGFINTCGYGYSTVSFNSPPGPARIVTGQYQGHCAEEGQISYSANQPDFTGGTPATRQWQYSYGNWTFYYANVSYNGSNSVTFNATSPGDFPWLTANWDSNGVVTWTLPTPSGNVTCSNWDPIGYTVAPAVPDCNANFCPSPCKKFYPDAIDSDTGDLIPAHWLICNAAGYTLPPEPGTGGGTGDDCFPEGTKVLLATNDWKTIETIQMGDSVIGKNGQVNRVIGLHRPPLGDRPLYRINDELSTTEDHLILTESTRWGSLNPEDYAKRRLNKAIQFENQSGEMQNYYSSRIPKEKVEHIKLNTPLKLYDGTSKLVTRIEQLPNQDPAMILYTLITDGNGSFTVQGGYVVDGMPQK